MPEAQVSKSRLDPDTSRQRPPTAWRIRWAAGCRKRKSASPDSTRHSTPTLNPLRTPPRDRRLGVGRRPGRSDDQGPAGKKRWPARTLGRDALRERAGRGATEGRAGSSCTVARSVRSPACWRGTTRHGSRCSASVRQRGSCRGTQHAACQRCCPTSRPGAPAARTLSGGAGEEYQRAGSGARRAYPSRPARLSQPPTWRPTRSTCSVRATKASSGSIPRS